MAVILGIAVSEGGWEARGRYGEPLGAFSQWSQHREGGEIKAQTWGAITTPRTFTSQEAVFALLYLERVVQKAA